MENFEKVKPSEEIIRKLSKTVLHAAERQRKPLFDRLTAENSEKIVKLLNEKPVFYENKEDASRIVLLDDEIAEYFPQDFFDDPTKWIERQENIKRETRLETLPTGETIKELWDEPYDISKVKEFSLIDKERKKVSLVSKRVDKHQIEEIVLARKAWEVGIPTARVFGEIMDKGNAYVFFERIQGINFLEARDRLHLLHEKGIPPSFSILKKDFGQWMQYEPIYTILTDKCKKKLYSLWEKMMPAILRREAIVFLDDTFSSVSSVVKCFKKNNEKYLNFAKEVIQNLKIRISKQETLLQQEINVVLCRFNYSDYVQFLDHCLDAIEFNKKEEFGSIFFQLYSERKNLTAKIENEFERPFVLKIYEDVFGFNPYKEIKKVKSLCEEKGIEHKDFNERNILIEWDFNKSRPIRKKKSSKNKIYIIDWEPKKNV